MVLCTLGDLVLDVIVAVDRWLVAGDDVVATTRVGAGGQAANVAAWGAALGARARYVGRRGDDAPGRLVGHELGARGVEVLGPVGGRTGVVVSLVGGDRDRSMASDRGSATQLRSDELDPAWFASCDWLHVSGYTLAGQPSAEAAATAARMARAAGGRISLDASSATLIQTAGPQVLRERVTAVGPDVLFVTADELRALGEGALAPTCVVKRGAGGCSILRDGRSEDLPAVAAVAIDATGAGDAFAAGYLVGGARLGVEAGARCVATMGAMP